MFQWEEVYSAENEALREKRKKESRRWMRIGLVAVAMLLLGAGGWVGYRAFFYRPPPITREPVRLSEEELREARKSLSVSVTSSESILPADNVFQSLTAPVTSTQAREEKPEVSQSVLDSLTVPTQ